MSNSGQLLAPVFFRSVPSLCVPEPHNHHLSNTCMQHISNDNQDETWMEEALALAVRAQEAGEVPVGAVVVCESKIVGRGFNRVIQDSDPTAHAEIIALREAAQMLGNYRLGGCELFVTIEPCAMCAGALLHARLKTLVYGTDDPKAGAVRSVLNVLNHPQLNHQMEVRSGVLAKRCAMMLQEFFRSKRVRT